MEVEQEAAALGWTPREQFRGDPEKFIEAADFLERGRHIMPILRKNNEKLVGTVGQLQAEVGTLKNTLAGFEESTKELIKFHEESTKQQVAKARADLLAEIKEARTSEDVDAEVAAVGRLSEFDAAQKVATTPTATPQPTSAPLHPEVKAWMAENTWYGVDKIRTGMAMGVAEQFRANGDLRQGKEFLDAVAGVVESKLGPGENAPPASKVEANRGGGQGRSGGTDYTALPADARAQCDKQASKFVGPDKVFKTAKEWNTHYAEQYFKGN